MKFAIVRPAECRVEIVDAPDSHELKSRAGLDPMKTDNGTLAPGLGYICGEHAMFEHPQFYFAIGRTLLAGNVVLYGFDQQGRTIDFDSTRWFIGAWIGDEAAAEDAIKADEVDRPQMAIEGRLFWQWPQPMPDMQEWGRRVAELSKGHDVMIDDVLIMRRPIKE